MISEKILAFSDYQKFLFANPELLNISPWSTERIQNDVGKWLEFCHVSAPGKILEIGCGFALYAIEFARRNLNVTAIEQFPEFYREIAEGFIRDAGKKMNLVFEKFPCSTDQDFDVIFVINNFFFWDNPREMIVELKKRLKKNGFVITELTAKFPIFSAPKLKKWILEENGAVWDLETNERISLKESISLPYNQYLRVRGDTLREIIESEGFQVILDDFSLYAKLISR